MLTLGIPISSKVPIHLLYLHLFTHWLSPFGGDGSGRRGNKGLDQSAREACLGAWTHNDSPVKERTERWRCGCYCRYASPARRQRARCLVGHAGKAGADGPGRGCRTAEGGCITDRKSTRLNSSH